MLRFRFFIIKLGNMRALGQSFSLLVERLDDRFTAAEAPMLHLGAKFVLVLVIGPLGCVGQLTPAPAAAQPQSVPLPPSSKDMPIPDGATFPRHDDKSKPLGKRILDRFSPLCLDAIVHTCYLWGETNVLPTPEAEREFAKNFDVGDTYFKEKNYRGAESRFREALEYKPNDPQTTYKLGVCLAKLGRPDEARELYEAYLKNSPDGPDAPRVRKALEGIRSRGTSH